MEFKIIAPGGNEIDLIRLQYSTPTEGGLIFHESMVAKGAFGEMIFHNYRGDGFQIWYSNYLINHSTEIIGRADLVVVELHIQFQNHFMIDWDGVGENTITPFQFNLSHTPFVNNWAKFNAGKNYYTFDIHFTKDYLARLAPAFQKLDQFLEKVEKAAPSNYAAVDHFLTPEMVTIVQQILRCSFSINVSKFYVESKVQELLIHALEHASEDYTITPIKLSNYDIERLHEAKAILIGDFENKISLMQLAKKVGLNDFKLKKGFKFLFGTPVFQYQQAAKMEAAKKLLLETKLSIDEVGFSVGFDFVSNFNYSFKKHFGYTPGYLRKKQ